MKPEHRTFGFTFITHDDTFLAMKATNWEFTNRALLFGLIFAVAFPLYSFDHQNSTATLANWIGARLGMDADLVAHLLLRRKEVKMARNLFLLQLLFCWVSMGVAQDKSAK